MKKQYFTNLLFGFLLLVGTSLASCSDEDSINKDIESETRTMTFDVSQDFGESADEKTRGLSEKSDTIHQQFDDGMEITTVIKRDKAINSRATASVVDVGTKVLAIVVDENNKIRKMQTIEIETYYKLTCEVPNYKVRIIFYSYNNNIAPTIPQSVGDDISSNAQTYYTEYTNDAMIAETGIISPGDTKIGTILFKHLFSRARLYLHYESGNISNFTATLKNISNKSAKINFTTHEIERSNTGYENLVFSGSNYSPKETIYSSFLSFIPRNDNTIFIDVTLDNLNSNSIQKTTNLRNAFEPGYSYTIYMTFGDASRIVNGWSRYYEWDAKTSFDPGQTPSSGSNSYCNAYSNTATYSCINCPTIAEVERLINSGVYWDDYGPEWRIYNGTSYKTYTTGIWVKKKSKWVTSGVQSAPVYTATDAIRTSKDYVFMPASGFITNETTPSSLVECSITGTYWTNERAYFYFNKNEISYGGYCALTQGLTTCDFSE